MNRDIFKFESLISNPFDSKNEKITIGGREKILEYNINIYDDQGMEIWSYKFGISWLLNLYLCKIVMKSFWQTINVQLQCIQINIIFCVSFLFLQLIINF